MKYLRINLTGRFLTLAFFSLLFLTAANFNIFAQSPGDVDQTFAGGVSRDEGQTYAIIVQPDGKHLFAGTNSIVNGRGRNLVARLNEDGTIDESFVTDERYTGQPLAMALQPDGKILIGGAINILTNPNDTNAKRNIARLNADGTLDVEFSTGGGTDGNVNSIVLQPDGKILIGGRFKNVNGVARRGIARLNTDGSLDTTFNPSSGIGTESSYYVEAISLQSNGQVVIGGFFAAVNGVSRNNIARLNADGSLDTTFNVGAGTDQVVLALAAQPDGKVIIGGNFSLYNSVTALNVARLNPDGSRDASFLEGNGLTCPQPPCANRNVNSPQQITVLSDGRIYISNRGFQNPNPGVGGLLNTIVRFNSDGSVDGTFSKPVIGQQIAPLFLEPSKHAVQADGKIVTNVRRQVIPAQEVVSTFVSRFNSDGSFDSAYLPILHRTGNVYDVVIQPDGKVIAVGGFSVANNAYHRSIARFNTDGTLDNSFNARTDGDSRKVVLQPDGKILVAGIFAQANGVSRGRIARFNADGTLDTGFTTNPGADIFIYALSLQADGKILIGGNFTTYNTVSRKGIARLNADGSLDTTFNPGTGIDDVCSPCTGVQSIDVQTDGKILVGGNFNNFNGVSRVRVARLNTDGTLDTTFNPGAGAVASTVSKIKSLSNGKILIAGNFVQYNNIPVNRIARLNADGSLDNTFSNTAQPNNVISELYVQSNGKIIISGLFSSIAGQPRRSVARLNDNGTLDASFGGNSSGGLINGGGSGDGDTALAVDEAGGKIYFGGVFSTYNNIGRGSLARLFLGADRTVRAPFDFDGDGKTDIGIFRPSTGAWWINSSSSNVTVASEFGSSSDKLVPGDFTGDGKADVAFFRPSEGFWYVLRSENASFYGFPFGSNGDVPVPGDYDGDGVTDAAVFRPSNNGWYIQKSTGGIEFFTFGISGDVPTIADYDGDGKTDIAINRINNGNREWWIRRSSNGQILAATFGETSDKAVPGDYTGDGKADIAFWRESNGFWYILRSEYFSFYGFPFGTSGDKPTPGDYDGDGKFDAAVYRPSNSGWYQLRSTQGFTGVTFGIGGDIPIPSVFVN